MVSTIELSREYEAGKSYGQSGDYLGADVHRRELSDSHPDLLVSFERGYSIGFSRYIPVVEKRSVSSSSVSSSVNDIVDNDVSSSIQSVSNVMGGVVLYNESYGDAGLCFAKMLGSMYRELDGRWVRYISSVQRGRLSGSWYMLVNGMWCECKSGNVREFIHRYIMMSGFGVKDHLLRNFVNRLYNMLRGGLL